MTANSASGPLFYSVLALCKASKIREQLHQTNCYSTRPTVDVLAKSGVKVTVACRTLEKAQGLAKGIPNTNAISVRTPNPFQTIQC